MGVMSEMTVTTKWKLVWIACGALILGLVMAASGRAWGVGHEDVLHFNRAVALPGVVLPAGSYAFDIVNPSTTQDVVIVRNAMRTQVLYLGATTIVERPKGTKANASITFAEASPRNPPPI